MKRTFNRPKSDRLLVQGLGPVVHIGWIACASAIHQINPYQVDKIVMHYIHPMHNWPHAGPCMIIDKF